MGIAASPNRYKKESMAMVVGSKIERSTSKTNSIQSKGQVPLLAEHLRTNLSELNAPRPHATRLRCTVMKLKRRTQYQRLRV
jgi:hypothetical protein